MHTGTDDLHLIFRRLVRKLAAERTQGTAPSVKP